MADPTNTPPITYPTVVVGGKQYQLKFGMGALFVLNSWGVDVAHLDAVIAAWTRDKRDLQMVVTLSAASLGRVSDGKWHSESMKPIELADTLLDGEFLALSDAVVATLGKASLGEEAATQPATQMPISTEV